MPDFGAQTIGFYLQVADQATPILEKAEARYTALTKAMEANAKVSKRSSNKAADGMSLLAGSLEAVSSRMEKANKGLTLTSARQGAAARGARGASSAIRLKAVYPRGKTDPHFRRAGMMQAYRDQAPPPDYILKIPGLQEGGIAMSDMLARIGEAGPEAVIPLDKLMQVLPQVAENQRAEWLKAGFKLSIDQSGEKELLTFLEQLQEGTERWETMGDTEREMFRQMIKDAKKSSKIIESDMVDVLDEMETKIGNVEKAMGTTAKSVGQSVGEMKDSIMSVVFSGQTLAASLAVVSFGMAASFESSMFEVRSQMQMTDKQFEELSDAATASMNRFGLSMEEATGIAKAAAFNKLTGDEMRGFVETTSMASQAFEALGVSVEDTTDLMWNGMMKLGMSTEQAGETLSGMLGAAKLGNVELSQLADTIKDNSALFREIARRGGDVKEAMLGVSAVTAELANGWIDSGDAIQFASDVMDRAKWGEMGPILGQISQATGKTVSDLERMASAGNTAGVMMDYVKGALSVTDDQIRQMGSDLQKYTGYTREQVNAIRQQYKSVGDSEEALRSAIERTREAAADQQALRQQWEATQGVLMRLVDRIKNIVIPIFIAIGKPLVDIVSFALTPLVKALRWVVDLFNMLPGPVKWVTGAVIGLAAAWQIFTIAAIHGAIATAWQATKMFVAGVASNAYAIATGVATAAQWLFNAAVYANPIGIIVVAVIAAVAALAALAYGFYKGATWAKVLGLALLTMLGPIGWVIAAVALLYDTFLGGGDIVSFIADVFSTIVDYIVGAVDWIVDQIEALPKRISDFIEAIPEMIASIFEGGRSQSKVGKALSKMFDAGMKLVKALFWELPSAMQKLLYKGFMAAGKLLFDAITWPYRKAWEYVSELFDISGLLGGLIGTAKGAVAGFLNAVLVKPMNSLVEMINAALAYVPDAVLPEALKGGMEKFEPIALQRGGIVSEPTIGLVGEAGPEAVVPLTALGEFMDTAGSRVAGQPAPAQAPNVEVNLDQARVESLLDQILQVLKGRGAAQPATAASPNPMLQKMARWEM